MKTPQEVAEAIAEIYEMPYIKTNPDKAMSHYNTVVNKLIQWEHEIGKEMREMREAVRRKNQSYT